MCAGVRVRGNCRYHYGGASGLPRHVAIRLVLSSLRTTACPLRYSGECDTSADRARTGRALLWRVRPGVVLHYFSGDSLSRAGSFHAFQIGGAGAALVVPGRAGWLYRLVAADRLTYPDARSSTGPDWHSHCALRSSRPQIYSWQAAHDPARI